MALVSREKNLYLQFHLNNMTSRLYDAFPVVQTF